jgi:hypothetical protein
VSAPRARLLLEVPVDPDELGRGQIFSDPASIRRAPAEAPACPVGSPAAWRVSSWSGHASSACAQAWCGLPNASGSP